MVDAHDNKIFAAVFIFLLRGNKIFLLRRANTGWSDGTFSVPTGHVEENETPRVAAIREAKEESGVEIDPDKIKFAHVMYRGPYIDSDRTYCYFCFAAEEWKGEPHNAEPAKCDLADWFEIESLPEKTLPYMQQMLKNYLNGIPYSEFGWN